jgi:hypothetical protein
MRSLHSDVLTAGMTYFGLVFGAGFRLGPLRVLFVEPRVGARWAELLEAPVMFVVIMVVARWAVRCWTEIRLPATWCLVGLMAASLVLAADVAVGVGLRGLTVSEVFINRDPVTGPVYYGLVASMAAAPCWFRRA